MGLAAVQLHIVRETIRRLARGPNELGVVCGAGGPLPVGGMLALPVANQPTLAPDARTLCGLGKGKGR